MRAAVVSEFGPFDAIRVQELETPVAGDGEIVVRTSVAGVNFADAGMVTGAARRNGPPFVPGVEASGVVESMGAGVTELSLGQRVVY
jgi:NADPH2:quinone reductase